MMHVRDVVEWTKELMAIDSTTGREGNIAAFVAKHLRAEGFVVTTQLLSGGDPSVVAPRMNVLARDSIDVPLRVLFTTHVDTVPPFILPSEDDERIYGRGACDAKGSLAALWCAAESLIARGIRGVGLLAVVGEETDSIGAKCASALVPRASWIINGEPTDLVLVSAQKGLLGVELRTQGVACHSAYPERGHSAVHDLVGALARLLDARFPGRPEWGETTVNIGSVSGGVAPNVVAPSALAQVVLRLAAPLHEVRACLDAAVGPNVEVHVHTSNEPLRLHVPDGYVGRPVSFGSDAPYLSAIGRTLLVGPGSIHDAHTDHESIRKSELKRAVDYYRDLALWLLNRDESEEDTRPGDANAAAL